jgi:hypothetical protein
MPSNEKPHQRKKNFAASPLTTLSPLANIMMTIVLIIIYFGRKKLWQKKRENSYKVSKRRRFFEQMYNPM